MKHSYENKSHLNFFDSTSFLMLAVFVILAITIFLPLSIVTGKSSLPPAFSDEKSVERLRQNIAYESFHICYTDDAQAN